MTAMLSKLFRTTPKWQSIKSQKRIEAIQTLSPELDNDVEILTRLAKEDSEPAVRREAVKKLHDFDILMQIQKRDLEAMVREAATERLHELMAGKSPHSPSLQDRLQRLERINSPQTLTALIREAEPVEIRLAAIAALNDEMYLHDIALHSPMARLRHAAAERIHSPIMLEELATASRHKDKTVYKLVKARLDAIHESARIALEREARAMALCDAMEAQARAALNPLYAAKTESLRQQWAALGEAGLALAERFATAYALACQQVADVQAQAQRAANEIQAQQELQGAFDTLEDTLKEYQGQESFDQPALAAVRKTQRLRWELAAQLHTPTPALTSRYESVMQSLDQLESLLARWQQDKAIVEATLESLKNNTEDEATTSATRQLLIDLVAQYRETRFPLPALLQEATLLLNPVEPQDSVGDVSGHEPARDNKAAKESLGQQLGLLEAAIESGNSRDASRQWRQIQEFARRHHLNPPRLHALGERVRELKSWAGFAVLPKKEALLADMQALSLQDIDPDDKADRIRVMQDEWKSLGVTDPSVEQPLWEKFKAASDAAYEPCRQHFAAQREVRAQNMARREQLCVQLEQYLDAMNDQVDWKNHGAIIKTARQEWQSYSPVDHQQAKAVQNRFHMIVKNLEQRLESHWKAIEQAKRTLVENARKLTAETDNRLACDKIKVLQQEWRGLGQASPRADRQLWKEFRAACDITFNRRDEALQARNEAREGARQQAESLIQAMQQLAQDASDALLGEANRLEEAFHALSLAQDGSVLKDHFNKARRQFDAKRQEYAAHLKQQQSRMMAEAWAAVCAAEQAQLDNTLPLFPDISVLPPAWRSPLQSRLHLLEQMQGKAEASSLWQAGIAENTQQALALLLELEISLDLPSPANRLQERRDRQLALLQEKGLRTGTNKGPLVRFSKLLQTGPVNSAIVAETQSRLLDIASKLAKGQ